MTPLEGRAAYLAARYTKTMERAYPIADSLAIGAEYTAYQTGTPGVWGMTKRSYSNLPDTSYVIDMRPPLATCTCPNFSDHLDYCKHTKGLEIALERDADAEAEAAQCAAYEARIASYGVHESLLTRDALR